MNRRKFHEIWIEQCDAAQEIRLRYGLKAAFDYVVAEKLLNFADAAASDPEFARELPRFIARVRGLFTPQEIRTQLDRIGHELREYDADIEEGDNFDKADELREKDELIIESPAAAAERARQFATIRELLTFADPGTAVLRAIELVRGTTDSGSDLALHWHGAQRQIIVHAPA